MCFKQYHPFILDANLHQPSYPVTVINPLDAINLQSGVNLRTRAINGQGSLMGINGDR